MSSVSHSLGPAEGAAPVERAAPVQALDPVAAVKDNVDRSRQLIAETLDDLSQHHSWLETYHREERRRAERLRRQEALERLQARRQKIFWTLRRFAAATYAASRAAARFVAVNGRRLYRWTAPRARQLTLTTALGLRRFGIQSFAGARLVSVKSFEAAKTGFLWSVQTSEAAGIAFRRHLKAASAALSRRTAILAAHAARASAPARKRAVILWLRTRRTTGTSLRQAHAALKSQTASTMKGIDAWAKVGARRTRAGGIELRRYGRHFRRRLSTMTEDARPQWRRSKRRMAVNMAKANRQAAAFQKHLSETAIRQARIAKIATRRQMRRLHRHLAGRTASAGPAWRRSKRRMAVNITKARRQAAAFEKRLSETVIRTGPKLNHLLQRYTPRQKGRALIVRPSTALTCITAGTST